MKKVYLSILSLAVCCMMNAQVAVTLNVDLSGQTVSENGVHVAGDFNQTEGLPEWNPAGIELTDEDGDDIYSVTLQLDAGVYQFKFVNGNAWGSDEGDGIPMACRYPGSNNRELVVGTTAIEKTFVWQGCGAAGEKVVRFRVDMSTYPNPPGVHPAGLHVAGNFQGWQAADSPLYDHDDNGIWEAYYSIGNAESIEFKYINGNDWSNPNEAVSLDCGVEGGNRWEAITETNTVLPAYCFNACSTCTLPAEVTFQVDMSLQSDVNNVYLAGAFAAAGYSDWNASGIEMTDADADGIYEVTLNLPAGTYAFKFVKNGSNWEEFNGECIVGGNRSYQVVGSDAVSYEACFNQCNATCVADPSSAEITFSVNMSNVTIDPAGPRLIGSFTNPAWQDGQITLQESAVAGIWYATVNVSGTANISYKFVNGVASSADESNAESNISECGAPNGIGGFNRTHVRTGEPEVLTTPCFDSCEICGTIISVEENNVVNGLLVYPNPVEDLMNVRFSNGIAQRITITLYNNMGQVVSSEDLGTVAGERVTTLNTADLATGIYSLAISNGIKNQVVRISVK
jgi:hypothetical protein